MMTAHSDELTLEIMAKGVSPADRWRDALLSLVKTIEADIASIQDAAPSLPGASHQDALLRRAKEAEARLNEMRPALAMIVGRLLEIARIFSAAQTQYQAAKDRPRSQTAQPGA